MSRKLVMVALGATSAAAACCATALFWTCRAVLAYERANGVKVLFADASAAAKAKPKAKPEAKQPAPVATAKPKAEEKPPLPPDMRVKDVSYDGDTALTIKLTKRPDMDSARRYISVTPLAEGAIGLRYASSGDVPRIIVTGDFAFRTNVTLTIRRGLQVHGQATGPEAPSALQQDFTYNFRRQDMAPYVRYSDAGRYLPPMGSRSIAVESVNTAKIRSEIRRVEPRNVVQMLAREEDVYSQYSNHSWQEDTSGIDKADTGELAGEPSIREWKCEKRLNGKTVTPIPVDADDGGPTNGIFLVAIRDGERPHSYCYSYYSAADRKKSNPNRHRVVCLTDLGISVRRSGGATGVWATSLKTGRPVPGCRVEIYSTANIKIEEGSTDECGWCTTKRVAKGEPFVAVVRSGSGDDMTFIALRDSMQVEESYAEGCRESYLATNECAAFLWTERGIYRHDERIFLHGLLRNGQMVAPASFPSEITLSGPDDTVRFRATAMPDANGAFCSDTFCVPADMPSGEWTFRLRTPGKNGKTIGTCSLCIEEFAPPQIRVSVSAATNATPQDFGFTVSAEHLFGGPAKTLACEGAVVFEDAPFKPEGWRAFSFGNEDLRLKPNFRRLDGTELDDNGKAVFSAPIWKDSGLPSAAVRAIGQGVVFEDGGRPATARTSLYCHYYPYYIGAKLASWLKAPDRGMPHVSVACVAPDGTRLATPKKLKARLERVDTIHSYRQTENGWHTWDTERVRTVVADNLELQVPDGADATLSIPATDCGDYFLTISDPESQVSFGRAFYLSQGDEAGDVAVRASLENPTQVSLKPDKAWYRAGETPRLLVKSPFTGAALLSVMRDKTLYTQVIDLTNATSVVALKTVDASWAPNVDVTLSVVQSVLDNARHLAVRAHGQTAVAVRPVENEVTVQMDAKVDAAAKGGPVVTVDIDARGHAATGTVAVVTIVDEGINLLTDEPVPDPVGSFATPRTADHPLFDLYGKILPVLGGDVRRNGVKTGGDGDDNMLGRVSPTPTKRFRPLALWKSAVPLKDGVARTEFRLPEFVGEVRVTAVAYSRQACGAAAVKRKVTPNIVMQPDAPRFAAPGDVFVATLPIHNRSDGAAEVVYAVGAVTGRVALADGASTNVAVSMSAPATPGTLAVAFRTEGCGETHEETLEVPVRPAAPWRERAGVVSLAPGEQREFKAGTDFTRQSVTVSASPAGKLVSALEWLADYPHGCLEQTSSRIFPLITADGVLAAVGSRAATNRAEYVAAGVKRVASMLRSDDFVMWPDCNYPPWDREVSLYAANFLVEAEASGQRLAPATKSGVVKLLRKWAMATNTTVSAYACHTLALADLPEKDRMLWLYDKAKTLSPLSRARLARAFARRGDLKRADTLLEGMFEPQSVKEAAFAMLALLERNPDDPRIPPLVRYLANRRDPARFSWGTTESNAHALLALGAYYRLHPPKAGKPQVQAKAADGVAPTVLGDRGSFRTESGTLSVRNVADCEAFVSWRTLELPAAESVTNEASGINISRTYRRADGSPADMDNLVRGELLVAELTLSSDVAREFNDLVVEDLFPGAFEPVHRELDAATWQKRGAEDWVMRKDARDDRMLVFSKKFRMEAKGEVKVCYPVRVVSAGEFILPGPSVEGMYCPALHARRAPGRIVVRR